MKKNKNTKSIHFKIDAANKKLLEKKAEKLGYLTLSSYLRYLVIESLQEKEGNKNNGWVFKMVRTL